MRRILKRTLVVLSVAMIGYAAAFSTWWYGSPVEALSVDGRIVHYRQVHYNRFFWHTRPVWTPAFWWMEHVAGHECISYVAALENSVVEYAK